MQGVETDRTRQEGYWTIDCAECGQQFDAKRSDASFCSPACRVRWSRRPAKMANALERLQQIEREVDEIAKQYSRSSKFFDQTMRLKKSIEYSLTRFEEQ